MTTDSQEIIPFENKQIRRIWHDEQWFFSVVDIVGILTESPDSGAYWRKLKQRLNEEASQVVTFCHGLKLVAPDGKMRKTDCSNVEGLFRIIQSVPSPKAEPIKLWLAQVGKERGAEKNSYGLLTALIAKGTFGVTPNEHKQIKKLKQENLRDHMSDLELILTMLGEATATKIHKDKDSTGLKELSQDSKEAGRIAGNTRKEIEKSTGQPVVTDKNYLELNSPDLE